MIWLALIIVVVIIFAAVSSSNKKAAEAQEKAELGELSKSRIQAYQDYLRRTSTDKKIKAMTDNELQDYLSSTMREYTKRKKEASDTYQGCFWITAIICAILASVTEIVALLFPPIAIGMWAYKQYNAVVKVVENRVNEKGLDLSRMTVEE